MEEKEKEKQTDKLLILLFNHLSILSHYDLQISEISLHNIAKPRYSLSLLLQDLQWKDSHLCKQQMLQN